MGVLKGNPGFQGLIGAQFLGAFNDNLFKQLVLFLAALQLFPGEDKQGLAFAVFSFPFIILSGIAGELSEKYSKRTIIVTMKVAEIGIMLAGLFALQAKHWGAMLGVLLMMGVHSAFFGPPKYGVIPELVPARGLLAANGLINMTTFLSVLLGQAVAGALLDGFGDDLWVSGATCTGLAILGLLFALRMRPLPAKQPALHISPNPFGGLWGTIRNLRQDRVLWATVLGNSLFWFNGGVLQQSITGLGQPAYLNIAENENKIISLLLVVTAVAIMAGSLTAPIVARRFPVAKVVLAGGVTMCLAEALLLLIGPVFSRESGAIPFAAVALGIAGFAGAFFVVPVQSYLQHGAREGEKGRAFAVNNFMNFLLIFCGGVWYLASGKLGLPPALAATGSGLVMAGYLVWRYPTFKPMTFTEGA